MSIWAKLQSWLGASASDVASASTRTFFTLPAVASEERGREVVIETPKIAPRRQRAGAPAPDSN